MLDKKIGITEKTWDFLWRDSCFLYNIMTSAVVVLCRVHQRFPSYCWYKRSTGNTERYVTMICNTISITFCCRNAHRAENETHRHWESESPYCWISREVWGPDQLLLNFFTWTLHLLTTSCDQHHWDWMTWLWKPVQLLFLPHKNKQPATSWRVLGLLSSGLSSLIFHQSLLRCCCFSMAMKPANSGQCSASTH